MSGNDNDFERFRNEFASDAKRVASEKEADRQNSQRLAKALFDELAPLVGNFPTRVDGNSRYSIGHEWRDGSYRIVENSFVRSRVQISSGFFGFDRQFEDREEFWGVSNVIVDAIIGERIKFLFDFGNFDYPNVLEIWSFPTVAGAAKAAKILLAMFSVDSDLSSEKIKKKFAEEFRTPE